MAIQGPHMASHASCKQFVGSQQENCDSVALLTYLLTYLLTPWSRILLGKLTGFQLIKKFPTFHGTRRFITAFTRARHLSLSRASSIQPTPLHPTTWISILILSSYLCLSLPSGLFHSCFPTKTLYTSLLSPRCATCPAHLILFDFITRTLLGEEYRSLSSSLCIFLHSSVTSSLLGSIIVAAVTEAVPAEMQKPSSHCWTTPQSPFFFSRCFVFSFLYFPLCSSILPPFLYFSLLFFPYSFLV